MKVFCAMGHRPRATGHRPRATGHHPRVVGERHVSQIVRTTQKVRTTHSANTYESLANTSKMKVFYAIGHHPRAGTGSITASQHHERECEFAFM